jgi:voltage-gated potassium channel
MPDNSPPPIASAAGRLSHWERTMEWPLTATALLFLAVYAFDVLDQPDGTIGDATQAALWGTWAVFAVDYFVRLGITPERGRWIVRHLLDLAVVVLPLLRPLRLLRLVMLLSVLQRAAGIRLYGRVAVYVGGSTVVLVTVSSLALLEAERGFPGSNINDYGQALWWAMVTMTTVGYGDKIPVSGTGHFIAVGLMIAGIALLGTVTATLASWLVQKVSEQDVASQVATKMEMAALTQEVASLGRLLQESLARGATAADPDGAGSAARRPEDPAFSVAE